ncbi:MAG: hemolysin III [Francisellaceae bacterium]|jgi:hemolysin III
MSQAFTNLVDEQHQHKEMYSRREDILNSTSHFLGMFLSIVGLILMLMESSEYGSATTVVASLIFGVAMISMYGASGFYHGVTNPKIRSKLRTMDHLNIYFLIAGTYTPIALIALNNVYGWLIFGVMWGLAGLGILYKLFAFNASWFSTILYVLMGWMAIAFVVPIIHALPLPCMMLIILGGLFYTTGVIFYMMDEVIEFSHFLWHIFVLLGSFTHFLAIYFFLSDLPVT